MKLKVARFGIFLTAVLASVALILPSTSTAATAGKKVHWDVSLFGSPRQLTYPINDWAKADRSLPSWNGKELIGRCEE